MCKTFCKGKSLHAIKRSIRVSKNTVKDTIKKSDKAVLLNVWKNEDENYRGR